MKQIKFECPEPCNGQIAVVGAVIHDTFATLVGRCVKCDGNAQLNVADILLECLNDSEKEPS